MQARRENRQNVQKNTRKKRGSDVSFTYKSLLAGVGVTVCVRWQSEKAKQTKATRPKRRQAKSPNTETEEQQKSSASAAEKQRSSELQKPKNN